MQNLGQFPAASPAGGEAVKGVGSDDLGRMRDVTSDRQQFKHNQAFFSFY